MGDAFYGLPFLFLWIGLQQPLVLGGLAVVILARPWLPEPFVVLRTFRRMGALSSEIASNPANVTARRDLAVIYLEQRRAGRAVEVLRQALARFPDDAELLYLFGVALHRRGEHEAALTPLVRAVELEPGIRFGEPYLVAGDALSALGRHAEALDAYERYCDSVSSSVQGHVKRARMARAMSDATTAKRALDEAIGTFSVLPGFKRRRELGWWLMAWAMRVI
ncbi:MAG: tetratricopeptide repeat protein [Polyangiaceae bacterium]